MLRLVNVHTVIRQLKKKSTSIFCITMYYNLIQLVIYARTIHLWNVIAGYFSVSEKNDIRKV